MDGARRARRHLTVAVVTGGATTMTAQPRDPVDAAVAARAAPVTVTAMTIDADDPIPELSLPGRCFAVTGTATSGPSFCGYPSKGVDVNGRPCCGRHLGRQVGVAWYGDRYRYPEGTGGRWRFTHGAPRTPVTP